MIEFKNVSKTYPNGVKGLKNVNLTIEQGEFVAVIGKSGSGKSTLLRLLATLDQPDQGDILLEGESILGLNDKKLSALRRRKIGFIYQDYSLFPEYTAYENIVLPLRLDGKKENRQEIEELMQTLGISACRDKFPAEMSGGEQQRTAIARALSVHPAIILADEPTGNLDAENSNEVVMLMSKAARLYQQTIIMVTHDKQTADYADRILTIKDGVVQN